MYYYNCSLNIPSYTYCFCLFIHVCQKLVAGQWLYSGCSVFYTNKIDRHDITEILLKVALNTITLTLFIQGALWLYSYGSKNYIYLYNQCLSPFLCCNFDSCPWWCVFNTTLHMFVCNLKHVTAATTTCCHLRLSNLHFTPVIFQIQYSYFLIWMECC